MSTIPMLVTAVGGDLGQSVIKCLHQSGYNPSVIGCDMNPYAAGKALCKEFYQSPPVKRKQEYISFILELIDRHDIQYVFPLSDVEIAFYNRNCETFDASSATFVTAPRHLIDTFIDKYQTVQFFKAHNIPYPQTYLQEEYRDQLPFPLIMKKRTGSGSQSLLKITDREELDFYLKRKQDMIIQEYIPGHDCEYTSGLFSDGQDIHTITFRRTLAPGGFSQQVEIADDKEVFDFPRQVARVLDLKGSVNLQFRKTSNRCVPFEINPRFSSTVYFRHLFGFCDVQWNLDIINRKPVTYSPSSKKAVGVRTFGEVIFEI